MFCCEKKAHRACNIHMVNMQQWNAQRKILQKNCHSWRHKEKLTFNAFNMNKVVILKTKTLLVEFDTRK